ncbi:MAG: DEAD/DEAH box helicase [Bacteroidota bacterium]|nr:DEAD/DEAH box helicase [Bacteroidota bacterium]
MKTFTDQGLNDNILKAIDELGFIDPTPIQEKTIPAILNSHQDIIGLAQTGTGKTAGFGLPILQQLSTESKSVQSIILCPTRELCLQITKDLVNYSKYMKNVSVLAVYGGASIEPQIKGLKRTTEIVVGTPGRTLDLIKRRILKIENIRWLVLDEADEMLNMGFREDLNAILEKTPKEKQTLIFSATMPKDVRRIADNYMNDPVEIVAGKKNVGAINISHEFYMVKASDRYIALKRLADINPNIYALVFCRTRRETKDIAAKLINDGYNADALHGDLSQAQRELVMNRFRSKQLQLLVATDVAARGIDINDLTHVLNYNLPDDPEVYIHRSGRTGRAGKSGISISIIHSRDGRKLREIEKLVEKKFQKKLIPTGKEICEKRLYTVIDKIERVTVDEPQIEPFLEVIYKKLSWLDRDELIKRFVSVEFNRFLEYYKGTGDINFSADEDKNRKERKPKKEWKKGPSSNSFSRFFINIGSKQKLKATNLIGLINENTRKRDIEIGKIEILRNFSFFEIEKDHENLVLDSFKDVQFGSVKLSVQLSSKDNDDSDLPKMRREKEKKYENPERFKKSKSYGSRKDRTKKSYSKRKPRR